VGCTLDAKASDPIERHIAELLRKKRILPKELRMLIAEADHAPAGGVEALPNLRKATKTMTLDWIAMNCADLAECFTAFTANQRTISPARLAKAVVTAGRV
jgi:hypothetical protein